MHPISGRAGCLVASFPLMIASRLRDAGRREPIAEFANQISRLTFYSQLFIRKFAYG
jgi:hypothetical protein